ncbi:MAG: D-alanyl-D-alanine carboxypeptidase [Candidatus Taylorbacteria bacterium]|nr:D-alanyl-D-alanine carboxypeptidase [Candidatus Taylorbacteria bacterium]
MKVRIQNLFSPFGYKVIFIWIVAIFSIVLFFWFIAVPTRKIEQTKATTSSLPYDSTPLIARSAYVFDVKTGKSLYEKNANAQLPLASLTKIMTAVTALSLLPQDAVITIQPEYLGSEGDSGLFGNERWTFKDLLGLTLLESSNDGASAIASTAGQAAFALGSLPKPTKSTFELEQAEFVLFMNKTARELKLDQSYFLNPTGLDISASVSGAYGSARDVAKLFSYAQTRYPTLFEMTRYNQKEFESLSLLKHKVKNTNIFVSKIPSFLGSKTGFTDLAGGNLVISFDAGPDYPVVISVLGSTEQGRFEDAEKLVYATLEYLKTNNI